MNKEPMFCPSCEEAPCVCGTIARIRESMKTPQEAAPTEHKLQAEQFLQSFSSYSEECDTQAEMFGAWLGDNPGMKKFLAGEIAAQLHVAAYAAIQSRVEAAPGKSESLSARGWWDKHVNHWHNSVGTDVWYLVEYGDGVNTPEWLRIWIEHPSQILEAYHSYASQLSATTKDTGLKEKS